MTAPSAGVGNSGVAPVPSSGISLSSTNYPLIHSRSSYKWEDFLLAVENNRNPSASFAQLAKNFEVTPHLLRNARDHLPGFNNSLTTALDKGGWPKNTKENYLNSDRQTSQVAQPIILKGKPKKATTPAHITDGEMEEIVHLMRQGSNFANAYQAVCPIQQRKNTADQVTKSLSPGQLHLLECAQSPTFRLWSKKEIVDPISKAKQPNPLTDQQISSVFNNMKETRATLDQALRSTFQNQNQEFQDKERFLDALNIRGLQKMERLAPHEMYRTDAEGNHYRLSKRAVWHNGVRAVEVTKINKASGWEHGVGRTLATLGTLFIGLAHPTSRKYIVDGETVESPTYEKIDPSEDDHYDGEFGYDPNDLISSQEALMRASSTNNIDGAATRFPAYGDLKEDTFYQYGPHLLRYMGNGKIILAPNFAQNKNMDRLVHLNFVYGKTSKYPEKEGKPVEEHELRQEVENYLKVMDSIDKEAKNKGLGDFTAYKVVRLHGEDREVYVSKDAIDLDKPLSNKNMIKLDIPDSVWHKGKSKVKKKTPATDGATATPAPTPQRNNMDTKHSVASNNNKKDS